LAGQQVHGMAFTLHGGRATWDKAGAAGISQNGQTQAQQPAATPETTDSAGLAGTYSLAAAHSGLCADVLRFSEENGADIVQWTCNNEVNQRWTLEPRGEQYKVIAEHSGKCLDVAGASLEEGYKVHQWECLEVGNQLWSLKQVTHGYQIVAEHSGKCLVVKDASAEAGAGFVQWACSPGDQASNDVFALNPVKSAPDVAVTAPENKVATDAAPVASTPPELDGNLLVNSGFDEIAGKGWWSDVSSNGGRGIAKVVKGEYCFNVLKGGTGNRASTRLQQHGFNLEPGQPYVLSFEAYADEPRTIIAVVGQHYAPWTARAQHGYTLQNQKQTYHLPFVANATESPASYIDFYMGDDLATNAPFQVCFDNVTLQKGTLTPEQLATANTGNVLGNSGFDDSVGSLWRTWAATDAGAKILGEVRKSEYCVSVEKSGAEPWHTQIFQRGFLLEPGKDYTFSFDAYADKSHRLLARISQGYEPWKTYKEQPFDIGTEKQTFTMPFTLEAKEPNSSAEFWLGGEFASDVPVQTCFDNVVITENNVAAAQ
jgi:hypothetical protein